MSDSGLKIAVACKRCPETHEYGLDHGGQYDGPMACDASRRVVVQVHADDWRAMLARERDKIVH